MFGYATDIRSRTQGRGAYSMHFDRYEQLPPSKADEVIKKQMVAIGGDGGAIAITPAGDMAWSFNTEGMYRARAADGKSVEVDIYEDAR